MQWKARRRPREEGTGETPQRSEEAPGPPAGKRSAWNGNQQFYTLSIFKKKAPNLASVLLVFVNYCVTGLVGKTPSIFARTASGNPDGR
ncbi:hypothetical protein FZC75_02900 [Sutcliffiella horikoshii]|uniref:Uncharacterized protein n=1 Tax=Sutcliffiella horikoshii TaxID=79883 RepID=A0A5D4THR5_9BACI|nr:hypothetical protein FZC75_02900 [Sutcliffiella horikoshii]